MITALIGLEETIRIKYKYFIEEYNKIKLVDINIYYDPIIRIDNLPKDNIKIGRKIHFHPIYRIRKDM